MYILISRPSRTARRLKGGPFLLFTNAVLLLHVFSILSSIARSLQLIFAMAVQPHSLLLLCLSTALLVQATPKPTHHRDAIPFPITAQPLNYQLRPRQAPENPGGSICGYRNGNLERGWKAPEGSTCFLDHSASYFGWCNALFTKTQDCTDVPRACVDSSTCSGGCGKTNEPDLPTITW
jgi:hypothetical protein